MLKPSLVSGRLSNTVLLATSITWTPCPAWLITYARVPPELIARWTGCIPAKTLKLGRVSGRSKRVTVPPRTRATRTAPDGEMATPYGSPESAGDARAAFSCGGRHGDPKEARW